MAYSKTYYEEKRIKLTNQIVKKMEDAIVDITNILNKFYSEKKDLVADLQEIVKLQQENEPETKELSEELNKPKSKKK
jgi:hypothetical protein